MEIMLSTKISVEFFVTGICEEKNMNDFEYFDFDNLPQSFRFYGGSDKKDSVKIENHDYMIKFPSPVGKRNDINTSISNSVYSEFIGCHIVQAMGYPVQETLLGCKDGMTVVACRDFIPDGYDLVEFSKIENRIIDSSDRGRVPALCNIEKIFDSSIFTERFRQDAIERYWDIFVIDSYLGNFDRHCGNWGYLVNRTTGELQNAPIYDCGSSLYPQLSDEALPTIYSSPDEMKKRIEIFPKAALTLTAEAGAQKVGYGEMLSSHYHECDRAVLRVVPQISISKTYDIIDETPDISEQRKHFYKTMLSERYRQLLLEPYRELARERGIEIPKLVMENERIITQYSQCHKYGLNINEMITSASQMAEIKREHCIEKIVKNEREI